ncbi:MAG: acyl-ACP desaturase [Cytophagales bacterium]|nr:acyl-ACP desaturase [Armatimonadota bacterium]
MSTFDPDNHVTDSSLSLAERDEQRVLERTLTGGRAGEPEFVPVAPWRGSVNAQVEEIFFENFLKYFKNAEQKRRWNIETDIPWDKTSENSTELTAQIVESFTAVEMYLPDYTHKIMELVRRSRGRAWFQANWGFEESKHSLVLEEWLIRSGKRTEEQMREFENQLLGAEWQLPFDSPRQMIIYTMIQELATGINYTNLRRRAEAEGDEALARTLRWVSADESAHYNFFRKGVKTYLALQPEETINDIKFVFDHFAMPAHALIPEWQQRGEAIEAAGIYGPKMYLAKIRRPILEDLNITRQQLKQAGLPIPEADESADRTDAHTAEMADRAANRAHFVGGRLAPIAPPHRRRIMTLGA